MYIISKRSEKDYYDGVAGTTGIDKTIVYTRHILEVEGKDIPMIFRKMSYLDENPLYQLTHIGIKSEYKKDYPDITSFIIGFCGKLYPGWKLYSEDKGISPYSIYNDAIIAITYDDKLINNIAKSFFWRTKFDDAIKYIHEYNAIDVFRLFNTPVFVYDYHYGKTTISNHGNYKSKFLINPLLKEYEFYKLFDSFQAFQEIQMFIGGVLGNKEKGIIEVADKYKIAQHGFDKWSFRKLPENK